MNSNFYTLHLTAFLVALLLCTNPLAAQSEDFVAGELLVQLVPQVKMAEWQRQWNHTHPAEQQLQDAELLSRPANVWLLHFEAAAIESAELIDQVYTHRQVLAAQRNQRVRLRAVPNDLRFDEQWQYDNTGQSGGTLDADIDATEAWDQTTGGTTLTGDTIVVAVLDNGIDLDHPDLQRNRWINHAEIPNNDIDDDANGYVDDYLGWRISNDTDDISGGGHGTPVAGIVGADGNNNLGVTGVNWNVKLMIIHNNFNTTVARVIEAYSYPLEQRQRYNASGGAEGAFVVATNASWGVDGGMPSDAPIWCNFYDTLGEAGIINCGATANEDFNVEITGDLPTGCPSDYLIGVTNSDHNDMKEPSAGYGNISIDLSAPGSGVFTTRNGGNYGTFGGTSGATPHVAGAAALLYSLNCPALMALAQADPGAAALLIKEAILEGVDPVARLADITVTGGRLNVKNSLDYLAQFCDGCLPASSVQVSNITDAVASITWNTNDSLQSVDLRWRAVGTTDWNLSTDVQSPFNLQALTACQDYEFQLRSICASETIPFQNSRFFTTDGCCDPPSNIALLSTTTSAATLSWDAVLAAEGYMFRFRENGTTDWMTSTVNMPTVTIDELTTCTIYEYQIRTLCAGENTDWTNITTFITSGCGPCLEEDYCVNLNVLTTTSEFIERVEIGGFFSNISDGASTGYQDFGGQIEAIELEAGETYPIVLTPGFPGADMFVQDWRIWLDIDHNGDFTSNEIIFDTEASNQPINGMIDIPATASLGVTRMRVIMQFNVASSPCPFTNSFGEMEDYCVSITASADCNSPENFVATPPVGNALTVSWDAVPTAVNYEADYRPASGVDWIGLNPAGNSVDIDGLDSCANYVLRVKTICASTQSFGYSTFEFDTCPVGTEDLARNATTWQLMPNPFREALTIVWQEGAAPTATQVVLVDALGRAVLQQHWSQGQQQLQLDAQALPAGLYSVMLYQNGKLWSTARIVKN